MRQCPARSAPHTPYLRILASSIHGGNTVKSHHRISKQFFCAILLTSIDLLVLLLSPSPAGAQTNALISGTVTDKSGAAVVGAQVVIDSLGGNLTRTTETNNDGVYAAPSLPPGTYNLTVTA